MFKQPLSWLLWLGACLLLLWLALLVFTLLPLSKAIADDDTGLGSDSALGYASGLGNSTGLNGGVENGATALPQGSAVNIPRGVRPLIVLPPESLQPRTLVVPLPGEQTPPVILRRNSIEVLPSMTPALPRSRINNGQTILPDTDMPPAIHKRDKPKKSRLQQAQPMPGKAAPSDAPQSQAIQPDQGKGSIIRTTPLDPILD